MHRVWVVAVASLTILGVAVVSAPADAAETASAGVGDVLVYEGRGLQRIALVPVTLDRPLADDVTIDFATVDGTAVAGLDYLARSGSLVFPAGSTQRHVAIPIRADLLAEDQRIQIGSSLWQLVFESFTIELSNPAGAATVDRALGRVEIRDRVNGLTIDDVSILEGDLTPRRYAELSIYLDRPATERITGRYTTDNRPSDYRQSGGTLEFQPGQIRTRVRVPIVADEIPEGDDVFEVRLYDFSPAANVQDSSALVRILDDD